MFPQALLQKSERLLQICRENGAKLATAESCTGGLIGGILTEIAGSSDVFERGHIVYSNHAKTVLLGVQSDTLKQHGAVSSETAAEMAAGALLHHPRETANSRYLAIAVTGVAGPGGGSAEKPVGTIWFGLAVLEAGSNSPHITTEKHIFDGDRRAVRLATVNKALDLLSDNFIDIG
jgi:nicotinamide-nucleotide amidase